MKNPFLPLLAAARQITENLQRRSGFTIYRGEEISSPLSPSSFLSAPPPRPHVPEGYTIDQRGTIRRKEPKAMSRVDKRRVAGSIRQVELVRRGRKCEGEAIAFVRSLYPLAPQPTA